MTGKVYIVGAGPGDPKLITVRGLECLRSADVVIYDHLVNTSLLEEAPAAAERIYVGKQPDYHLRPQEQINETLAMHAALGKNVTRLKGGDPFVFGRGGEEAVFLAQRGIPFEIVPGISSAIAVPAFAGIPVTQRGVASGFAVLTGHSCGTDDSIDYAGALRSVGTLVILMGVRNLSKIVAQMRASGIGPAMPIAIIQQGTYPEQRSVVSTLGDIVRDGCGIQSPAVIIVGQVVSLGSQMRWFEELSQELMGAGA